MPNKKFSERLNKGLDNIDVPESTFERVEILSKLLKVPKFKAELILNGAFTPDAVLLENLAHELEVDSKWLLGKEDS